MGFFVLWIMGFGAVKTDEAQSVSWKVLTSFSFSRAIQSLGGLVEVIEVLTGLMLVRAKSAFSLLTRSENSWRFSIPEIRITWLKLSLSLIAGCGASVFWRGALSESGWWGECGLFGVCGGDLCSVSESGMTEVIVLARVLVGRELVPLMGV